ncbi:MAG: lysophospholipid acyltransferase family protein [Acidimicrobiia bacterium]|nr:MAG: lysophospholipid acyltransferase family protein [Acidimicrobiia bacterium]
MRIGRWDIEGEVPDIPKMVVIGAPHTSAWDFPIGMLAVRALGLRARYLGKHTLFRRPFGWFFRMLGGIPVDRSAPGGLIAQSVAAFENADELRLLIAPEGTRNALPHWRSGFYEIARGSGVPVLPGAVDGKRRRIVIGEPITVTGDVAADMEKIRSFYEGFEGIKPGRGGSIRLASEA